jgi:hypothetical protein
MPVASQIDAQRLLRLEDDPWHASGHRSLRVHPEAYRWKCIRFGISSQSRGQRFASRRFATSTSPGRFIYTGLRAASVRQWRLRFCESFEARIGRNIHISVRHGAQLLGCPDLSDGGNRDR